MKKLWSIGLFFFLSFVGNGQENKLFLPLSISFSDISIDSALQKIELQTALHFTFNSDLIKNSPRAKADFQQVPLCIVLDSIFTNPRLDYKIIENQLVVFEQTNRIVANLTASENLLVPSFNFGGFISDTDNGEPLPFAAISLQNSTLGTMSNEEGVFSFKMANPKATDTILISYMGYQSLKLPLQSIGNSQHFRLQSVSIPLQEVVIRGLYPENLIRLAISYKEKNYPNQPFNQRAFYREYIKRDKNYSIYSEGILDISKRAYRPTLFREQVRLVKQRTFKSFNLEDSVQFKLHGGIQSSLDLDVVKNDFPFLMNESMSDYVYQMRDMVLNDGKLTYKIEFNSKNPKMPFTYEGCIYIDVVTMAFVKIEFEYSKMALQAMRNAFVLKRSPKLNIVPIFARYSVSYKQFEGFYYIHHIKGELGLKVKRKQKFLSSKYYAGFEMVATELSGNESHQFVANQKINASQIFSDLSTYYDLKFWESENFVLPEEDLMKAFERLSLEN